MTIINGHALSSFVSLWQVNQLQRIINTCAVPLSFSITKLNPTERTEPSSSFFRLRTVKRFISCSSNITNAKMKIFKITIQLWNDHINDAKRITRKSRPEIVNCKPHSRGCLPFILTRFPNVSALLAYHWP